MRPSEVLLENELRDALGASIEVSIAQERALERLLRRLGVADDPTEIRFPNARLSLTHAGGASVAVGTNASVRGIGVDLELGSGPPPGTERFFLAETERQVVNELGPSSRLRLWTVKEALYKADPGNAATWFTDYRVDDPRREQGRAHVARDGGRLDMRYASFAVLGGWLTVAVCR